MKQGDALKALEWLTSERPEDRQTGRSTVEAIALLRQAVRTGRETQIAFVDTRNERVSRFQQQHLADIAHRLGIPVATTRGSFRVLDISEKSTRLLFRDPFPWSELTGAMEPRRSRAERLLADDFL